MTVSYSVTTFRQARICCKSCNEAKPCSMVNLLVTADFAAETQAPEGCSQIVVDNVASTQSLKAIAKAAEAEYVLLSIKPTKLELGYYALERMLRVAADSDAAMVYSDHFSVANGETTKHPVIDYQWGSLRDDFDFGQLVLIKTDLLKEWAESNPADYKFAGFYDLRLFLSRKGHLFHIDEFLYTDIELDTRLSGAKQFDYVNPRNREVQVEMEKAATCHLEAIGALVDTSKYADPNFDEQHFENEASIVIPVYNRVKTVADAVKSALGQKADFPFNVIVVDNHSTDGTTEILNELEKTNPHLVHLIPERTDLGIGGCWNVAVSDSRCGRFAVQLDSDDIYSSPQTLETIVKAFHEQKAAMIIGSYRICDFELNTLPPGLIDHKEWTDQNGPNNALRINGLGAPRAFFTPLVRQIQFPNTSYGEDYALGLMFSRKYRIGRIFDELYLCRRWDGNSDAESLFFSRFTGRPLRARFMTAGDEQPAGSTYAYQTYRNYGGYDLAWCGRLQSADSDLMDGVQILVQGALVPDNAVIKYKVRLPDGTEEARSICLLDCTRTDRDANGDYLATVEDTSILNAKLMIWDG